MKNCIVFGASSDLGREIVKSLINNGIYNLILTEKSSEINSLSEYCDILKKEHKQLQIEIRNLTINDTNISQCIDTALAGIDKIDYCVYVIGVNYLCSAFQVDEDIWDEIMTVNLKAYFFSIKKVAEIMMKNDGGKIVGISSQHGSVANLNRAPYCASKAAMNHLTRALALEWAKYKILINVVAPTFMVNSKNIEILNNEKSKRVMLHKIPTHCYATTLDVTEVVIFLLLSNTKMITGQVIHVDGGWCIQ